MADASYRLDEVGVLECADEGPELSSERDATDVIGAMFSSSATWAVIPVARLGDGFLDLKTRIAGLFLQKFVNYDLRVAIVGDISAAMAASSALRDFVQETNRGSQVWFLPSLEAFRARLAPD